MQGGSWSNGVGCGEVAMNNYNIYFILDSAVHVQKHGVILTSHEFHGANSQDSSHPQIHMGLPNFKTHRHAKGFSSLFFGLMIPSFLSSPFSTLFIFKDKTNEWDNEKER